MRRIATAAVAATTAMSLVAAPAMAKTSSEVTSEEATAFMVSAAVAEAAQEGKGYTPLLKKIITDAGQDGDTSALASSIKNDAANQYTAGTTLDILLGTGIAAGLLALLALLGGYAVSQGIVQLPF